MPKRISKRRMERNDSYSGPSEDLIIPVNIPFGDRPDMSEARRRERSNAMQGRETSSLNPII
jgi:hypothetical protein